jgi:hypothetical protein
MQEIVSVYDCTIELLIDSIPKKKEEKYMKMMAF